MEKRCLTLNEACELLGISRVTARKWIEVGRLKATRKNLARPKSPYMIMPESLREALNHPSYQVQASAVMSEGGIINKNSTHNSSSVRSASKKLKEILSIRAKRKS
ncbi:helix-turn-helix domain-containing protein [Serratia marcescens]|uniref:helix-turn-helix domain-containing protein n=1 Tax=Serratia marcescens TaxID=615 RepID=UPI0038968620